MKIDKITIETYGDWQALYVRADKETIAKINQFIAELNAQQNQ